MSILASSSRRDGETVGSLGGGLLQVASAEMYSQQPSASDTNARAVIMRYSEGCRPSVARGMIFMNSSLNEKHGRNSQLVCRPSCTSVGLSPMAAFRRSHAQGATAERKYLVFRCLHRSRLRARDAVKAVRMRTLNIPNISDFGFYRVNDCFWSHTKGSK